MDWWHRTVQFLLGLDPGQVAGINDAEVMLRQPLGNWTLFFCVLLLGGLSIWAYRRTPRKIRKSTRLILTTLRATVFALLLLLLMRPVLQLMVESTVRQTLLVGIDVSSSAGIADFRNRAADQNRAALLLGDLPVDATIEGRAPPPSAQMANPTRADLIQAALSHPDLDLYERLLEKMDVQFFTFGERTSEVSLPLESGAGEAADRPSLAELLRPESPRTQIGTAVREMLDRKRGQPVAGMLLMTDGANNGGLPPLNAAVQAGEEGIPLYFYAVGITTPRDIIVNRIDAPDVATVRDQVRVIARIRTRDLQGQPSEVRFLVDGEQVATQPIRMLADGEISVEFRFTPEETGEVEITIDVPARPDEVLVDNNRLSRLVRVIDEEIRVLLAESSPRWEYRYLEAMLNRDRRIELDLFLENIPPSLTESPDSPYLQSFPDEREELFGYDVIILGDLDPEVLPNGTASNLSDFVGEFGGGLILLAGREHNPWSYNQPALGDLLPITFEDAARREANGVFSEPTRAQLTTSGARNPMLQLVPGEMPNQELWEQLPPIYWVAPVERAKPTAEVLAIDPSPLRENRFGNPPLIAVQGFGRGQTVFVGTDNLWRWRQVQEVQAHTGFWLQLIQRLALNRLLKPATLSNLRFERSDYVVGERVRVYARLFREGFLPLEEASVPALLNIQAESDAQTEQQLLNLQSIPDEPGRYRADFIAREPGRYRVALQEGRDAEAEIRVTQPRFEQGDTALDLFLLSEMSQASGGRIFREEHLHDLPDAIEARIETVETPLDIEVWSSPIFFLLVVCVLTLEWIIRKVSGLK